MPARDARFPTETGEPDKTAPRSWVRGRGRKRPRCADLLRCTRGSSPTRGRGIRNPTDLRRDRRLRAHKTEPGVGGTRREPAGKSRFGPGTRQFSARSPRKRALPPAPPWRLCSSSRSTVSDCFHRFRFSLNQTERIEFSGISVFFSALRVRSAGPDRTRTRWKATGVRGAVRALSRGSASPGGGRQKVARRLEPRRSIDDAPGHDSRAGAGWRMLCHFIA